jgi:surface carbohydrate biosynthesis protein (TIGR04326 family)
LKPDSYNSSKKTTPNCGKLRILLCGDIDPESTNAMLHCVKEATEQILISGGIQLDITYKSHPVMHDNMNGCQIHGITETKENIKDIIHNFDIMIASDSTSAAVEAYQAGLKVIVFTYTQRLNFSPLKGVKNVSFVMRGEELSSVLTDKNLLEKQAETETFFWSDPALPRWRAIFKEVGFKQF